MSIYQAMHFGPSVGVGESQSVHLGIAAIGKRADPTNPYVIVNEVLAANIAHYLRLPVPPCCIITDGNGVPYFASLSFNLTGQSLPPIIPAQFYSRFQHQTGSILLFDCYIANSDRHAGNLSEDTTGQPRCNVFDHSHVLLSGTNPLGSQRLTTARNSLVIDGGMGGNRHCLIDLIDDERYFDTVLNRIETIPDWFIEAIVAEVSQFGLSVNERDDTIQFLKDRRAAVRSLIIANRGSFSGIQTWRLI
jgi:hypothetical protein